MNENRTVESYVAQAVQDACSANQSSTGAGNISAKGITEKIMYEVQNYNAREISRDLAYMRIDSMIRRIVDLSTGGTRTFTTEETWLVDSTVNELMNMFTGYTIAAE